MISVIVPVFNDPEGIGNTLDSLVKQSHDIEKHEIVVIDNGSTDTTPDIVREFTDNYEQIKLLFEQEKQGSYAARNRGIEGSEGEVLAFVDSDMTMDETWLSDIEESMKRHECPYVGSDVRTIIEGKETLVAQYEERNAFPIERYLENDDFVPTCCLIARRELFEEIGLFDDRLVSGGDVEFGQRVHKAGYSQRFEPEIVLYHPARASIRELVSKMFRVGRGLRQYSEYHPDRFRPGAAVWRRPIGYLPPHPTRFLQQDEYRSEPFRNIICFFFLSYLVRLARTAGAG